MSGLERKAGGALALSDVDASGLSASGPGSFEGRASTFDSLDSYGDVVARGAYSNTLKDFLATGFVSWSHDWNSPVAMPVGAEEKPDGLWIRAQWHSDPQAQMYRGRVVERAKAGLSTGLSIGYTTVRSEPGTGAVARRLLEVTLHEVAVVMSPAEPKAGIGVAKRQLNPELEASFERYHRLMRIYGDLRR